MQPNPQADKEWADLDAALVWGAPVERVSKAGRTFVVREAPANDVFWQAWKACKECVKEGGFFLGKTEAGAWVVSKLARLIKAKRPQPTRFCEVPWADAPAQDGQIRPAGDPSLGVPVPAGKALLPAQLPDVQAMVTMGSVLLAHEQGLGKTVMIAALCNAVRARTVLIVTAAKTVPGWMDELRAWTVSIVEPVMLRTANAHTIRPGMTVVASYEAAQRAADTLRGIHWDVVAFDECHLLGNVDAQRTVELISADYRVEATFRICASGTPFKNRPIELWPVLRFLDPERWGSRHAFGLRYCRGYYDQQAGAWNYQGSSNLVELREILLQTVMLRRKKGDTLPPMRHELVVIPPNATQAALIKREAELAKVGKVDPDDIAKNMARGDIDPEQHLSRVRAELAVTKLPALISHAEEILRQGEKLIVFVHHKAVVDALAARWGRYAVKIVGGQTAQQTAAAVKAFQTDPQVGVCIASIRAAGAGLTLTAARRVLFGECDWAPASMDQAAARCHRIGQTRDVLVEHLVLDGSLDAIMYGINARKRRSSKAVFN